MEQVQIPAFPDPLPVPIPLLKEKPRQGVPGENPAPHPGRDLHNSTVAIGLRAAVHLDAVRSRFTGKERDSESGNDYFGARYYASSMGRFLSPDEPFADFDPDNPQSWNLYGYVRNNPLINTDPDGTDCVTNNGDGTATINSGDCSGKDPNNEYYYDCGDGNDGCLVGATSANMTSNGALALNKGNTIFTISNFGYSGGASFSDSLMYNTFGPPSAGTWNNSAGAVNTMGAALATGAGVVAPEMLLEDTELIGLGLSAGDEDTFVIGKVADLNKG